MKTRVLSLLLALVSPSLFAAPERVADILKDMQAHGYASPSTAASRLQSAPDAADTHAPVEQRRRYYAALIALALPDKDTRLLQQALDHLQQMAEREDCKPCRTQWLIGKAQAAVLTRNLKQARANLDQAEALVGANDRPMQLQLALARIRLERAQGALNVAFSQTMAALDLAEQLGDNATHIELSILLAVLNAQLGYLDRAEATAREAAAQAQAADFTAALALARLDQGYIYARRNQRARQVQALQQALAIAAGVPGLAYLEVIAHANLSDYYLDRGDYAATLHEARQAAELAHTINDLNGESIALANIGIATARTGDVDAGVASLRKALELAQRTNDLFGLAGINRELVNVLQSAGRYKEALASKQAFDAVNREITQQARDSAVQDLQAKHDDERKNRRIEQLSTQTRLQEAEATARRWQQRLWITLAAIAVLAALLLVLRLAHARRTNRQLVENVASLTEQSALDELTGVFNRRHFAALMQPYEQDAAAQVGLVMLDIDHFKQINDNHGHDVGDAVLKEVALRLQSCRRGHDHVVRWGGEEFVLVLSGASPQSLPLLAQRLLEAVAKWPIHAGQHPIRVSVSAGCVVHPLTADSSREQALRLADRAMYRAKRQGRNRAVCVTRVSQPIAHDFADSDLDAAMRAGTIVLGEVAGPDLSSTATDT